MHYCTECDWQSDASQDSSMQAITHHCATGHTVESERAQRNPRKHYHRSGLLLTSRKQVSKRDWSHLERVDTTV